MGRHSVMTPEIIDQLKTAFSFGCTDVEACFYADIGTSSLYEYQIANPKFSEQKAVLKSSPVFKARKKIMDLMNSEDEATSFKASVDTLNRYDGKPVERVAVSGPNGGPIETVSTITDGMTLKEAAQAYKEQLKDI